MSLNTSQIKIVDDLYRNASLVLLKAQSINKYLKDNGSTGYTIKNTRLSQLASNNTNKQITLLQRVICCRASIRSVPN